MVGIKNLNLRKMKSKKLYIYLVVFLIALFSLNAYFTNVNKFLVDSIKDDGNGGLALERESNEFIVDGCGEGTMLDTLTGLCWIKNMSLGGSLAWAINSSYPEPVFNISTKSYDWPSGRVDTDYPAFKYCNDLVLGGRDDWRLPSKKELFSLIDQIGASGSTCITLEGFSFEDCIDDYYWVNSEYNPSTSYAWEVGFDVGYDGTYDKASARYVTCVARN